MKKFAKGNLEVICGPMFSGKSEELIKRLKRAHLAKKKLLAFKHSLDERMEKEYVISHNGSKIKAIALDDPKLMLSHVSPEIEVIGIDEVNFFSQNIVNVICTFIDQGKRVIAAGLDLDFKQVPFGPVPLLLAIADKVIKLKAICMVCGKDAHLSQRLVNEKPAQFDDPTIMVGAAEKYQARCRNCYEINKQPVF